jgi:hypothetical protein
MDSIRDYLNEKQFNASEVMQSAMMFLLSVFLIGGGVIIINDEDIFKKIYEGYQMSSSLGSFIPEEERMIFSGTHTATSVCETGYQKYSVREAGIDSYFCAKCPDGRNLQYSDGTPVSPGAIDISQFSLSVSNRVLRCKLPSGIGGPLAGPSGPSAAAPAPAREPAPAVAMASDSDNSDSAQTKSTSSRVSNSWTADLPDDLSLAALQRNISNLRKKSDFNIAIAAIMIIIGSIISIYQIYKLFFS